MNILGIIASFGFVGIVLVFALTVHKVTRTPTWVTRKIVHILVSNWWFLLLGFFTELTYAVIGPLFFIVANLVSYQYHLIPAIELADNRKNLGTVYFPITLLILVVLGYTGAISLYAGGVGVLVMGYADGLAALVGKRFGRLEIQIDGRTKTLAGTLTMFAVSFLVVFILNNLWSAAPLAIVAVVGIAVTAALVELLTPFGLDNITVPIITAFVYNAFTAAGSG
ncbi:MAG: diacylglycerol/polyprenol kinase family protein [Spirochaetota bacterium]